MFSIFILLLSTGACVAGMGGQGCSWRERERGGLQGIYVDTGALGWRDSTGNNSQKAGNRTQTHWTLPTQLVAGCPCYFPPHPLPHSSPPLWRSDCSKVKFKKIQHKTLEWRVSFHFVSFRFVLCNPPFSLRPLLFLGFIFFLFLVVVAALRVRHVRYNLRQLS